MEQTPTLDRFHQQAAAEDRQESRRVNAIYARNMLQPRGFPIRPSIDDLLETIRRGEWQSGATLEEWAGGTVLQATIKQHDRWMAPAIPGGERFGYRVAKNAYRWQQFRTAFLEDHKNDYSTKELVDKHSDVNAGLQELRALSPAYFLAYDLFEKERLISQSENVPIDNPFEYEQRTAPVIKLMLQEALSSKNSGQFQTHFEQMFKMPGYIAYRLAYMPKRQALALLNSPFPG